MKKNYSANELEQLQQRAVEGDAEAQELWGMALQYGDGTKDDYEEASRWYQRAAEQGRPLSQGKMGWNYLTGNSVVEEDIEKGFSLLKAAIEAGDAGAYASMSLAYSYGLGVESDSEYAVSLAQKAVERGVQPRNRLALAEALLIRDVENVDISEITNLYESVLADEDADSQLKENASERMELMENIKAANALRDELRVKSHVLGPAAFERAGEDFLGAVDEMLHGKTTDGVLPSSLIQSYLDAFKETQGKWYQSYTDGNGHLDSIHAGGGSKFGYSNQTLIVEGDETPYLVLDQDGNVQKLRPGYDLDEESLGEMDAPLVCTPKNVDGDVALVRYIPGRDGYGYPTWETDAELEITISTLDAIDEGVGGLPEERDMVYVLGKNLYRFSTALQELIVDEDTTIADIVAENPTLFDEIRSALLPSTAEVVEEEDGNERDESFSDLLDDDQSDEEELAKVIEDFVTLQEAAAEAMEDLYPLMQEMVKDPDLNMGGFPFFVQHGDLEVLLVLHEDRSVERLEEDYELPGGSFTQDVDGLVTVEVPEPLGVLRFIQVLPDTQW